MSRYLPPDRRANVRVAFAFFRLADDMVDSGRASPETFRAWREQANRPAGEQSNPILAAWSDVRDRHGINPQHVNDLLDGIEMDLTPRRYATLDELRTYCYYVAGTVGLISLPLLHLAPGVTFDQAAPHAAELCTALQLINIIRDVGEDLDAGRIYLPLDELAAHGLSYADIEARVHDDRFRALMAHLAAVARSHYDAAWPKLALLSRTGRFVAGAGAVYYRAMLDELERGGFAVYRRRLRFSTPRKLWIVFSRWPAIARPGPLSASHGNRI
ncbi:MAG: phytoene/squalene synthase family protein [Anaerolineales bacterium]|nr:phytoene/squalene synthase family protein [Anaerolineales bacterium]